MISCTADIITTSMSLLFLFVPSTEVPRMSENENYVLSTNYLQITPILLELNS